MNLPFTAAVARIENEVHLKWFFPLDKYCLPQIPLPHLEMHSTHCKIKNQSYQLCFNFDPNH